MRKVIINSFLVSAVLFVAGVQVNARSTDAVTELDPGVAVGVELNRLVRIDIYTGREKSDELESGKGKFGVGASFRLKPLFKSFLDNLDSDKQHVLVAGATYEYSQASEASVESIEHKLMLDATARYAFAKKVLV